MEAPGGTWRCCAPTFCRRQVFSRNTLRTAEMPSNALKCSQIVLKCPHIALKYFQIAHKRPQIARKCSQMLSNAHKCSQMPSKPQRRLQPAVLSNAFAYPLILPNALRCFPMFSNCDFGAKCSRMLVNARTCRHLGAPGGT